MENVKTDVKKEVKKVEAKKGKAQEGKAQEGIADAIMVLGAENNSSRKDLATKVVARFTKKGITKNCKGKTITVEAVTSQIGAIVGCITKNQGPKIWRLFKYVEVEANDEKHIESSFKILLK
jgi:hypothetical protein